MSEYNPTLIEKEWQKIWELEKSFHQTWIPKKKFYVLEMFPYPSGIFTWDISGITLLEM